MSRPSRSALALLGLSFAAGCGEVRDAEPRTECTSCHGGPEHDDGRPPPDLRGNTDTSERGVGAHTAHLESPNLSHPVECETCHVVPESVRDEGHLDRTADEKDTPADVLPENGWDHDAARCATTYCHTRSGAAHPTPVWTQVDQSQIGCDGCHGAPPPAPHPTDDRCSLCHPGVNSPGDGFDDVALHIDGHVDLNELPDNQCGSCHGRASDGAPPPSLDGSTETMAIGVGAHLAHVDSLLSDTVKNASCGSCHKKPVEVLDDGHLDASPAEVRFDLGLGNDDGVTPAWERDSATCTNTYCHGATLAGGTSTTPAWTDQTDDFRACDSCHGAPPPAPHPDVANCSFCHAGTGGAGDFVPDAALHVNGAVDKKDFTSTACDGCHGNFSMHGNFAPPADLDGDTDTTFIGVGAHQAHLAPVGPVTPVACSTCHSVPVSVEAPGHFDDARPAEVNASVGWNGAAQTCTNACHGAASPVWTTVTGAALPCGTCHGNPPSPPTHPTTWTDCTACHTTFPTGHVDGTVDVPNIDALACDSCHGDLPLNGNPAPPTDLAGSSLTTDRGVGAHQTHLSGGLASAPVACGECHAVPAAPSDAGHLDTGPPADVMFGTLAGPAALWDGATATCSGVYCHEASGAAGGALTVPTWTTVDGSQNACGNCHDTPPPSHAGYPSPATCENCHATATGTPSLAIVDPCLHINGVLDNSAAVGCP